jgi:hypothetical protein
MDNVGPFDRSAPPPGWRLEQSDATSWMAIFCLSMLEIAFELARTDHAYEDAATKFFEHFLAIAEAASRFGGGGLWDETDGFCYDILTRDGAEPQPLRIRSMSGLLPVAAVATIPDWVWDELPGFTSRVAWLGKRHPDRMRHCSGGRIRTLSLLDTQQLGRMLGRMLDESEFLSPYGIRSLSAEYRNGYSVVIGGQTLSIDYEPAESRSGLFGGNSNWRGPVWFPANVMLTDALRSYGAEEITTALPSGSGRQLDMAAVAEELERRLVALFLPGQNGRRPGTPVDHPDSPRWSEHPTFSEYFNGDTGAGLGASHQTGWTALVAALIARRVIKEF